MECLSLHFIFGPNPITWSGDIDQNVRFLADFWSFFQFKISTALTKSRREPVDGSFERRDLGVFAFAIAEFGRPADLAIQVRQYGRLCRNCTNRARAQKNWAIEGPKVILFERRVLSAHADFLPDIENPLRSWAISLRKHGSRRRFSTGRLVAAEQKKIGSWDLWQWKE